jgi:hypothetical protein
VSLIEFPGESEDYALGFEAGRLWFLLSVADRPFHYSFHVRNREPVSRMCERLGAELKSFCTVGEWVDGVFDKPRFG